MILDGRDTSPVSGIDSIKNLEEKIKNHKNIQIASVSGRFYSMDRDNRWDRIKKAYDAIISGGAQKVKFFY